LGIKKNIEETSADCEADYSHQSFQIELDGVGAADKTSVRIYNGAARSGDPA